MKTVRFYNSCLNITAADDLGLQPLKDLIKEYGGWSISSNYNSSVTITTRIGKGIRELDVGAFFGVRPDVDMFDSSKTILQVN
jgi:predicted metalloendopeptidase